MSIEDNKRVVANFVELCQNQHDLAVKDEILHPDFVNQPVSAKTAAIGSRNPGRQVATCRRHQRQGGGLDVSSRYDEVALSTSKRWCQLEPSHTGQHTKRTTGLYAECAC